MMYTPEYGARLREVCRMFDQALIAHFGSEEAYAQAREIVVQTGAWPEGAQAPSVEQTVQPLQENYKSPGLRDGSGSLYYPPYLTRHADGTMFIQLIGPDGPDEPSKERILSITRLPLRGIVVVETAECQYTMTPEEFTFVDVDG